MKRILALIFVIVFLASSFSSCQNNKASEGKLKFELNIDGSAYTLVGVEGNFEETEVEISTYNGLPITAIGDYAFSGCSSIKSVYIANTVTTIGGNAFNNCTSLENINIPNSVTIIEGCAFVGCSSLKYITIPQSITKIGECAFALCDNLMSIDVDDNNMTYKSIDGNLYTKNQTTLMQYSIGKKDKNFVVPESVLTIEEDAFRGCSSLVNIKISDCVKYIRGKAFTDCKNIVKVVMPNSVESVEYDAFWGCDKLEDVSIGDKVNIIGIHAFSPFTRVSIDEKNNYYKSVDGNIYSKDGKTFIQYAIKKDVSEFFLPYGVEIIEYDAFYRCDNLTSVIIPRSVKHISYSSFIYCDNLKNIKYTGTEEEWNKILKEEDWFYGAESYTVIYNYTGE